MHNVFINAYDFRSNLTISNYKMCLSAQYRIFFNTMNILFRFHGLLLLCRNAAAEITSGLHNSLLFSSSVPKAI